MLFSCYIQVGALGNDLFVLGFSVFCFVVIGFVCVERLGAGCRGCLWGVFVGVG